jgi:hypothetical protein
MSVAARCEQGGTQPLPCAALLQGIELAPLNFYMYVRANKMNNDERM